MILHRGAAVPPGPERRLAPGWRPIAGMAWAPSRGIEQVQVRIDDVPWRTAELAEPLDVDCWRQWHLPWDATPGRHAIPAGATDGRGEVQTAARTPAAPVGAAGHPTIRDRGKD